MPRDTSNKDSKARNSRHAAATGLKTGNLKVKGENFYRDAKSARRVNMLSGKTGSAVRNAQGRVIQEAAFQSKDVTPGRVQPDRRWFGNTRTISQTALEHFRTSLKDKIEDPYAVVLKKNKLPMSLLTDAPSGKVKLDLTTTEPFSDTFGSKAQRKRPRLDVGTFSELADKVTAHQNAKRDAAKVAAADAILEAEDYEGSRNPEELAAEVANNMLNDVPQDYILSAGTSRRIWGELYKVRWPSNAQRASTLVKTADPSLRFTWHQVIDSSDLLLHVLDARDPMGTRCESVEAYLAKEKRGKKVVYILNKVDLVPGWVAARWVKILSKKNPTIAFHASINNSFGKGSLIQLLRQFSTLFSDKKQISVGFIGYPNVGKSSIINTLKKKAVCKTAPIPGETKVWQYITLMRRIYLIDCPGIVPPSARDSESAKVLKGVVRVEHLSNPADHITYLLERVRPEYLRRTYGISEWTDSDDFLAKLANKYGKLHKGGEADQRTVATMVLNVSSGCAAPFSILNKRRTLIGSFVDAPQDWIRGKIPFFVAPPEPDTREANGKPLPKPLNPSTSSNKLPKVTKSTATGGSETLCRGEGVLATGLDKDGNVVKSVKGVTQPLHQIVHSTRFLDDDVKAIEEEEVVEEDGEEEEEEWGGIASGDEDEEEEFEQGEEDDQIPLQWDELFAQAVREESDASEGGENVEEDEDDDDEDEEVELILNPSAAGASSSSKPASSKKRAVEADPESDVDETTSKPTKEPRMKTNKTKATNYYTTANVKNRSRRGKPDTSGRVGEGKGTGKKRGGRKSKA